MKWRERYYCGELRPSHKGKDVRLMGWVDAIRDHGNILFIHLRDISGIVQAVFDPNVMAESYEQAELLREEYVIEVQGKVALREKGKENPNLKTGDIEVFATEIILLSKSKNLPFHISEKAMVFGEDVQESPQNIDEDLRLQYRYLDLRRPSIQNLFVKRYEIIKCIRDYLHELHFIEIETPILTKSTPEGARDYLVPSRVHHGKFYALPQSPQLLKQILMISGMDRYFQMAKCFRDEDLRPNRQPEFTQLDLEGSFIDEEFIYEIIEELTVRIFKLGNIILPRPFPRMTYQDAMDKYGTDRPDLRFDMSFYHVTDIVKNSKYAIFQKIAAEGGRIKGFCIKGGAKKLSKNLLQNEYALKIAPSFGAKGMSWMKVVGDRLESNIVQFFSKTEQNGLKERFNAGNGDVFIMVGDQSIDQTNKILSNLRLHMAERLGLIPYDSYSPLWVTNFPLFELKDGKIGSQHHPFTMPDKEDFNPTDIKELLGLKSRAYDLVMNGEELGGGSIRIHNMDIQRRIFKALGLSKRDINDKFGFFLSALEYGTPPHGGLALGMDRVISMILKTNSIRDVIAFPKNRRAFCPLTQAPSTVSIDQLRELGLSSKPDRRRDTEEQLKDHIEGINKKVERISREEVQHIAKLARLSINEEESGLYQKDLNNILMYVDELQELDTDEVRPMSHVLEAKNVWRDDNTNKINNPGVMLSNAPVKKQDYFKVPKILEG
ncbi:MAG: aspartate--tRNA ligase [Thermodesulfobacteriota bacterium]|nr:aspartate--tRNA ligase [Thermodesulfobacteriota bacterium]